MFIIYIIILNYVYICICKNVNINMLNKCIDLH